MASCFVAGGPGGEANAPTAVSQAPDVPRTLDSWFFEAGPSPPGLELVLIVLNWTLPAITADLWAKASLVICADGGANRVHEAAPRWVQGGDADAARRQFVPAAVVGDLDSLRADVREFYEGLGTSIHDLSADQDSTDLKKCLTHAETALGPARWRAAAVVAAGAFGGRLDHTLSALNTLFCDGVVMQPSLVLLGDGSAARAVPAGAYTLVTAPVEGPGCALVALGGPAVATTTGLAWDLDGCMPLAVGGLQSTSNRLVAPSVTVTTDAPLLWVTDVGVEARLGGGWAAG